MSQGGVSGAEIIVGATWIGLWVLYYAGAIGRQTAKPLTV